MENSQERLSRVRRKLIVSLNERGNAHVDAVVRSLAAKGFHLEKMLKFGSSNLIYGEKDGDYDDLEQIDGVERIKVEGTQSTI
jgi:hypothetical protein